VVSKTAASMATITVLSRGNRPEVETANGPQNAEKPHSEAN
jgi:hypothetical protein